MREIAKNIYMTEIPLPNNPLRALNFYLIKAENGGKSLIIDTGFNIEENIKLIEDKMDEIGLNYENTNLFLTHLHSDHTGLAAYFSEKGMKVYASETDAMLLNKSINKSDLMWTSAVEQAHMQGLDEDNLDVEEHPGYKYRPLSKIDYEILYEGDIFNIGDYSFRVLDFKGHTPGLIGLYDENRKILISGDHILNDITPNNTFWGFEFGDSLGNYLKSLDKAYELEVDLLLSSHRSLVKDHRVRIDELRKHHEDRLQEVRDALEKSGKSTVRTVTKQLHWDIRSKNWEEFPNAQKWFAAGEAHAHLEHLRALDEVDKISEDGVLYYFLK